MFCNYSNSILYCIIYYLIVNRLIFIAKVKVGEVEKNNFSSPRAKEAGRKDQRRRKNYDLGEENYLCTILQTIGCFYARLPVDSMREAVLTVSPKRQ